MLTLPFIPSIESYKNKNGSSSFVLQLMEFNIYEWIVKIVVGDFDSFTLQARYNLFLYSEHMQLLMYF